VTDRYYTTSTAFLEALAEVGVEFICANLGSDHPHHRGLGPGSGRGQGRRLPRPDRLPARDRRAQRRARAGTRRPQARRGHRARRLEHAEHGRTPLIITGHLGRDPEAVPALVGLCDLLAIGVLESASSRMNFPAGHPMHLGWHFTTVEQNQAPRRGGRHPGARQRRPLHRVEQQTVRRRHATPRAMRRPAPEISPNTPRSKRCLAVPSPG
jgi:hypothetical protein